MKANDLLSQFGDHRQRVQSAITSVCEGRGILLVDDENRENEGDLIFSAQSCKAGNLNTFFVDSSFYEFHPCLVNCMESMEVPLCMFVSILVRL